MRRLIAFCLGLALMTLPVMSRERGLSHCAGSTWPDRLQGLTSEGDLILASGRLAKLADIRLPDIPIHREHALTRLRSHAKREILVQGHGSRDRWNRISIQVRLTDEPDSPSLGHGLVAAGLAMVDSGQEAPCAPDLFSVEEEARVQRLGLWADASYNPIQVDQSDRLRDRIGTFVLVEGRIRSIGERQQQTYLNFGGNWAEDFTIIIPHRVWKQMMARGHSAEALRGRRIRARGLLQAWQGTALTIDVPEMIEHLEGKRLPR